MLTQTERRKLLMLVGLDLAINIADILSIAALLWVIRFYLQAGSPAGLGFLPAWLRDTHSIGMITIFFLLFSLKNGIAWIVTKKWYRFTSQVATRISVDNLSIYQQSGYQEFVHTDSSVHIRKIAFQPFEFCQYVLAGIPQVLTQVTLVALAIIAIILFKARLFLLLLAALLPPVIVMLHFIRKKLARARSAIKENNESSFQHLLDALKGYVESNLYDRNHFFLDRFARTRRRFSQSLFDSTSIQTLPSRVIEVFAVLGLFILVAIANWHSNYQAEDVITLGAFAGAAYKIIPGIVRIINLGGQVRAHGQIVQELLAGTIHQAATHNEVSSLNATKSIYSIGLDHVNFSYDGKRVLDHFSILLHKGDFLVLSGVSGSGKTTITNLLLGFLQPENGSVLINKHSCLPGTIRSYWPRIAYGRQQSFLVHDTLLRNITLDESPPDQARLEFALEVSGLSPLVKSWPGSLDKIITENGKNISGGQRQRIAIARAIYKDADVLILDEPFNELDEDSEIQILAHLQSLANQGKIIILVTHNTNSITFANKWISLDETKKEQHPGRTHAGISC